MEIVLCCSLEHFDAEVIDGELELGQFITSLSVLRSVGAEFTKARAGAEFVGV